MTLYAFPASIPSQTVWSWMSDQRQLPSFLGGSLQRVDFNGGRWSVEMTLPPLTGDDSRLFRNWLLKMSEPDGWGQVIDHSYTRAGAGGGSLLIKGASQTGKTLAMDGATVSVTDYLKAGDRLGLADGQVVEVANDVNSDASGNVTVTLVKPLIASPADNSAVESDNPAIVCVISDPSVRWTNQPANYTGYALTLVQDLSTGAPAPSYA